MFKDWAAENAKNSLPKRGVQQRAPPYSAFLKNEETCWLNVLYNTKASALWSSL